MAAEPRLARDSSLDSRSRPRSARLGQSNYAQLWEGIVTSTPGSASHRSHSGGDGGTLSDSANATSGFAPHSRTLSGGGNPAFVRALSSAAQSEVVQLGSPSMSAGRDMSGSDARASARPIAAPGSALAREFGNETVQSLICVVRNGNLREKRNTAMYLGYLSEDPETNAEVRRSATTS